MDSSDDSCGCSAGRRAASTCCTDTLGGRWASGWKLSTKLGEGLLGRRPVGATICSLLEEALDEASAFGLDGRAKRSGILDDLLRLPSGLPRVAGTDSPTATRYFEASMRTSRGQVGSSRLFGGMAFAKATPMSSCLTASRWACMWASATRSHSRDALAAASSASCFALLASLRRATDPW